MVVSLTGSALSDELPILGVHDWHTGRAIASGIPNFVSCCGRGTNKGSIGLIGLIGLAGLIKLIGLIK